MKVKLTLLILAALAFRLSLVFVAHHGDLNNNISWGTAAVERGLANFYEGESWEYSAPNQPPLTILMFAATRAIWLAVQSFTFPWAFWDLKGMDLLVKLPSILADLGIGYLIYKYFEKKKKQKLGLALSAVWLFNPVTWYNSAIWGQTDSLVNLLGLAAVLFLLDKRLAKFALLFTLSFLFKGSLLIFVPLLLYVAIKQKHTITTWSKAAAGGIFIVIAASIWFHPKVDLFVWLFNLYKDRILPGEIGFLTANAFNFWWLVDSGKVLDSTIYLGLPARIWGIVVTLVGIVWLLTRLRKISSRQVFLSLTVVSLITFLFMTRIHERYLFPFFPYATLLLGFIPWVAIPYVILSITHLLNLYHLFWAPSFAPLEVLYTNPLFPTVLAIVNIGVFAYLLRQVKLTKL